jgi:hypothetical protein
MDNNIFTQIGLVVLVGLASKNENPQQIAESFCRGGRSGGRAPNHPLVAVRLIDGFREVSCDGGWNFVGEMVDNPDHCFDPGEPGMNPAPTEAAWVGGRGSGRVVLLMVDWIQRGRCCQAWSLARGRKLQPIFAYAQLNARIMPL